MYLYLCLVSVLTHCCDILSQTIWYYLFISYLLIICIFIPLYTFHICMNFVHTSIWIFCHTYIVCKIFFSKLYLPHVVSLVFELFTIISHVVSILVDDDELFTVMSLVSILVMLVDDDESNNVKFVLIHMCDKWCETLHPYYIT